MKFFKLIVVVLIAIIGISVIMYNVIKFLASFQYTKSRLYKKVNFIRNKSDSFQKNLIPLSSEEIGELSFQQLVNKKIDGIKSKTITTIYNEPLLAYTSQIDKTTGKGYAVYYSDRKEFSFIHLTDCIEVFIDEQPFGRIKSDGSLRDAGNKVIAYISNEAGSKEIVTQKRRLALLNKPKNGSMFERVFYLNEVLSLEEAEILFALALPELTKQFSSH